MLIIAIKLAFDILREDIPKWKAKRAAKKDEQAKSDELALRMLTVAGLHKNAHATYRREPGSHRRVRV